MSDLLHAPTTTPQGLVRSPLTDQIVEWLSSRIISGEFRPNDPLPEVEISETLGCSRSPLREALRILAQQGLVDLNPGKTAVVAPLDPVKAAEFYDTRALLESHVTLLIAETITDDNVALLASVLNGLKQALNEGDIAKCQVVNDEFHNTLYEYCPNQTLVEIVQLIWRRTLRYGRIRRRTPERILESVRRKERLLELLRNRDVDGAAEMMRTIVLSGKSDVVNALLSEQPGAHLK